MISYNANSLSNKVDYAQSYIITSLWGQKKMWWSHVFPLTPWSCQSRNGECKQGSSLGSGGRVLAPPPHGDLHSDLSCPPRTVCVSTIPGPQQRGLLAGDEQHPSQRCPRSPARPLAPCSLAKQLPAMSSGSILVATLLTAIFQWDIIAFGLYILPKKAFF